MFQRIDAFRKIDIDPAAETNQPEALTGLHGLILLKITDDAAGDQTGDLHEGDLAAVLHLYRDKLPFVLFACLVEGSIDELARHVSQLADLPVDRNAVHVAVEDIHEDADTAHRLVAHVELFRRRCIDDHLHHTVSGGDDQTFAAWCYPVRVTEKVDAPHRQHEANEAEWLPHGIEQQCQHRESGDERITLTRHGNQYALQNAIVLLI